MDICRRQMQIRSDKEVLAECYRIWLVIQHPNEFDEYRKTIKIGKAFMDWREFYYYLPQKIAEDPLSRLAIVHEYEFWSSLQVLPARDQAEKIAEESKKWRDLIDVVYRNLDQIKKKKEELKNDYII